MPRSPAAVPKQPFRSVVVVAALLLLGVAGMNRAEAGGGDVSTVLGTNAGDCTASAPASGVQGTATGVAIGNNTKALAVTPDGSRLYAAYGGGILAVNLATDSVDTIAPNATARGLAVDPTNSHTLYFVDSSTGVFTLERIDASVPNPLPVTVVADLALAFGGLGPYGLAIDAAGNAYVSEPVSNGRVIRVAGIGGPSPAVSDVATSLGEPYGLSVAPEGDALFVAESGGFTSGAGRLLRIDSPAASPAVSVLTGGLATPMGVALDPSGRRLMVAEASGFVVTERDPTTGALVQSVAGTGQRGSSDGTTGKGTGAELLYPIGVAVDAPDGDGAVDVFVLDLDTCIVRRVERMPLKAEPDPETTMNGNTSVPPGGGDGAPTQNPVVPGAPAGSGAPQAQALAPDAVGGVAGPTPGGVAAQFNPGLGQSAFAAPLGGAAAGAAGGVNAAGGAQPLVAASPMPPPLPGSPQPNAELAAAGGAAALGVGAGADVGSEAPGAAPRYAMVAHRAPARAGPVVVLGGAGAVALFGCALVIAYRVEPSARRAADSTCRPRGAG